MKRYISKSDAGFIKECLEWNLMGYREKARKHLDHFSRSDGQNNFYRKDIYQPTIDKMEKYISWMNEIKRS